MPPAPQRSDLAAPMVISGALDYVQNPANGKVYTCKRAYERAVRAAGCVIVGNDQASRKERKQADICEDDVASDIKAAIEQLRTDNLSDGEMSNMLRAPAPNVDGFTAA